MFWEKSDESVSLERIEAVCCEESALMRSSLTSLFVISVVSFRCTLKKSG